MTDDVSTRLAEIRERLDDDCMGRANQHKARRKLARSDVPYLLSLVEEVGEALAAMPETAYQLARARVNEHAGTDTACLYDALRDAAQEGAE